MEKLVTSDFKLGIIAGGQLGKMLVLAASNWDVKTYVMDPDEHCPAAPSCHRLIVGDPGSYEDVCYFGKQVDLLTFEVENINIEALQKLKSSGVHILPDPDILAVIQDKGLQKQRMEAVGVRTAPFQLFDGRAAIEKALHDNLLHYPFVQKIRKGGYDGRGVAVIRGQQDHDSLMDGPSLVEEMVGIDKEISIIAARNSRGEIRCFPTVEMAFNPHANLVEWLACPAYIPEETEKEAMRMAHKIIEGFDFTGLLAMEFFVDKNGQVWLNEVAPRPHNSGHHTIESVMTSQYEQHLRAIFNFSLGTTELKMPAVMINLLGAEGHVGPVRYEGLTDCMGIEGVKFHLYGKKQTRPYRKMGHVTVLARSRDEALEKAMQVREKIKVRSWKTK